MPFLLGKKNSWMITKPDGYKPAFIASNFPSSFLLSVQDNLQLTTPPTIHTFPDLPPPPHWPYTPPLTTTPPTSPPHTHIPSPTLITPPHPNHTHTPWPHTHWPCPAESPLWSVHSWEPPWPQVWERTRSIWGSGGPACMEPATGYGHSAPDWGTPARSSQSQRNLC